MVNHLWTLPDGWEWVALDKICKLLGGGTPKRSHPEYFDGDIIWVTPTDLDIDNPVQKINDSQTKITELGLNSSSAKLLPAGTILFSSRATIGKIGIAGVPLSTNQGFANLVCNDGFDKHYLALCLKRFTENIKQLAGLTTYLEISKGNLRKFKIPIPHPNNPKLSLDIQQRIVARIESLFGEIKQNRLLLEQMRLDNEQLLDSAIKECFSISRMEMWENSVSLDKVSTITAKQVDPTLPEYQHLPHIGVDAIQASSCQLGNYRTIAEDGVTSGKYLFTSGSILYSKIRPYLRKSVLVDFKGLCSADIYPLSVISDKIEPKFLMWFLVSPIFTDYANSQSSRTRIPKINRNALFSFELVYPEYQEQIAITSYLDLIRVECAKIDKMLKEDEQNFKYLEQAILEKAFRGEL